MISPQPLKQGDTIGIISPSAGIAAIFPHRVENGSKMLESLGFKVKIAKNALKISGYTAGTVQERIEDLYEMFLDDEVKAIICSIGGNHSNQLLKFIDFDIIKNHPKIFIGYSDISVLHYAFLKKAGLQTFYGPCLVSEMGEFPKLLDYTEEYFIKVLSGEKNILIQDISYYTDEVLNWMNQEDLSRARTLKNNGGFKRIRGGNITAPIIGGCIPSINHLMGTEYRINPAGCIFFIDIPEGHNLGEGLDIPSLDAYLCDLDTIGVFEKITGLLVSVPYGYTKEQQQELEKLIITYTEKYTYPIILNFPLGHTQPMLTLPLMAEMEIDSQQKIIRYAL